MLAAIVSAIAGALVTALFTIFGEETKSFFLGKQGRNKDLVGKWNCSWKVEGKGKLTKDLVKVSKIRGDRVVAIGTNNAAGDYNISGRLSPSNLLTLTYEGTDRRSPLGGVIILELNATRDLMTGYWWEYGEKREFRGGATTWEKA